MYPERDSRADEFDDAVERRRSGDASPVEDPELRELVELASRLDKDLSDDIPDPTFREELKYTLLQSSPQPEHEAYPAREPAELQDERWYRRLVVSPWRTSAAAAACMLIVVVAFMTTTNPLGWGTGDGSEDVTSFQPVNSGDGDDFSSQFPLDGADDSISASEQWFTASFPPLDIEHVVLPPLLMGFLPLGDRHRPEVELLGAIDVMDDVEMPSSETVYYLNAPPDGAAMLSALSSILAVDGELVEGDGNGNPYRLIDDEDQDIMRWDPSAAFFHFRGDVLENPVEGLLDGDASPEEVARRFLELIGFDFYTIEYDTERIDQENSTEIRFRPIDFPDTGLEVSLGGNVFVTESGAIQEAQLYWLSLIDIEVVALRDLEQIIEDIEQDSGYASPADETFDALDLHAEDFQIIHVLTRLGESNFVLQPAVKIVGDYSADVDSSLPGPARYLVPAAANGD